MAKQHTAIQRTKAFNDNLKMPKHFPAEAQNFISCCLRRAPGKRWNIKRLLEHPFIARPELPSLSPSTEKRQIDEVLSGAFSERHLDFEDQESRSTNKNDLKSTVTHSSPNSFSQSKKKIPSLDDLQKRFTELKNRSLAQMRDADFSTPQFYSLDAQKKFKKRFTFESEGGQADEFKKRSTFQSESEQNEEM